MATKLDPATFAKAIMLEAADIPQDMTIAQWRAQRAPAARGSGRRWRRRRMRSARRQLLPRAATPDAARLLGHDV
jgi:hypothetical protein